MTLREIIAAGAKLDDEICIEAHAYDNHCNRINVYFSYSENTDIIVEKNKVTIVTDVQPVD